MALVFLLVLAGIPVAAGPPTEADVTPEATAQRPGRVRAELRESPFKTPPLEFGRPILRSPFRLFALRQGDPGANPVVADVARPRTRPARVVCTMRVVEADPSIDPGILVRIPAGPPDPIVRDDLSPCVE